MLTHTPRIGLIGDAAWFTDIAALLRESGYDPVSIVPHAGLIDNVLDHYPALLVVDGTAGKWHVWVEICKREQATRRLPVLVVLEHAAQETAALAAGADVTLLRDHVARDLLDHIDAHALLPSPALIEELLCQCQDNLPLLAEQGIKKFNKGAFYAQHDVFEDQWMAETGPVRELYRAVLQVGVAYYHITHGNHAGGLKMLRRVVQWFARLPDECQGIDVKQLREDAAQVRDVLAAMDPADIATFDRALLKPVPRVQQ